MSRLGKLPIKMSAGLGLSMIDRAVKEKLLPSRCTPADLAEIRAYFEANGGDRCFYCDALEPTRWDHLHAVSKGGDTMPGNLVPACARCDDSKQDRDVEGWIASTSRHRPHPERLASLQHKIGAYRQHFHYEPVEFAQRLSPGQQDTYARFRAEIDALRRHLEAEGLIGAKGKRKKGGNP